MSRRSAGPAVFVLALIAWLACAAPQWSRPGASEADLERERAECLEESGSKSGVMNLSSSRHVERCMRDRGWTEAEREVVAVEPTPSTPPSPEASAAPRRDSTSSPEASAPSGGANPRSAPAPAAEAATGAGDSDTPLSFDACFERCRALTDRSKEQCFDVCLSAGAPR